VEVVGEKGVAPRCGSLWECEIDYRVKVGGEVLCPASPFGR